MEANANRRLSYAAHPDYVRNAPGSYRQEVVLPLLTGPAGRAASASITATDFPGSIQQQRSVSYSAASTASYQGVGREADTRANAHAPDTTTTTTTSSSSSITAIKPRKPRNKPSHTNRDASAKKQSLFWVHSDPQSVAEGAKEDTLKRIRSHVMAEHNRKKRLENTRRHKSQTWDRVGFQSTEAMAVDDADFPPQRPPPLDSLSALDLPPSCSSTSSSSSPPILDVDAAANGVVATQNEFVKSSPSSSVGISTSSPDRRSSTAVASPWSYVAHGSVDPFNALHTQLSERMLRHLQCFLFELTVMACPLSPHRANILRAHWTSLVQRGPAPLHAIICVASSHAALLSGELQSADPNQQWASPLVVDTYHHRGETIRLVNEGLSDPDKAASDELIAAVSTLLTIEISSGNTDYLKIHLAGLRQMITIRNNFANLPPMVREQISWNDVRVACMALTKPIFPFVRLARPASANAVIPPTKELSILATRLISLTEIPGFFSEQLMRTIHDLAELVFYAESVRGENTAYHEFNEQLDEYFNNEVLYVEYSLNADRYTATGEAKGDNIVEGCVRLASLLFHNSCIWQFYPVMAAIFSRPVVALRVAVQSTMAAGCYNLCKDLLIWILFLGAHACGSSLPVERDFFITQLAAVMKAQRIHSWQDLRALLMGFFYVDRYYLVPLRGLWDEIRTVPVH